MVRIMAFGTRNLFPEDYGLADEDDRRRQIAITVQRRDDPAGHWRQPHQYVVPPPGGAGRFRDVAVREIIRAIVEYNDLHSWAPTATGVEHLLQGYAISGAANMKFADAIINFGRHAAPPDRPWARWAEIVAEEYRRAGIAGVGVELGRNVDPETRPLTIQVPEDLYNDTDRLVDIEMAALVAASRRDRDMSGRFLIKYSPAPWSAPKS